MDPDNFRLRHQGKRMAAPRAPMKSDSILLYIEKDWTKHDKKITVCLLPFLLEVE